MNNKDNMICEIFEYELCYENFDNKLFRQNKKFYYLKLLLLMVKEIEERNFYPVKMSKATKQGTKAIEKVKQFINDYIDKCKEVDPKFKVELKFNY